MKMKEFHIALLCIGICLISLEAKSQDQSTEKRAQIEELRQTYIAERLQLSTTEQAAFDKLQKEYLQKLRNLRTEQAGSDRNMREEIVNEPKEDREVSEEKAKEILMARIEREEAKTKLDKEYTEAMIQAISAKKTLEYKRLEREFRRELIHMVKDDRQRHRMNEELRISRTKEAEPKPVEAK
jgi:hypothetical protein